MARVGSGQRSAAAGREAERSGVLQARSPVTTGQQQRMGLPGLGDDRLAEPRGVIGAQDLRVRAGEREVDECFMPGRLSQFGPAAGGPDRLAHVSHVLPGVQVYERLDTGDDPRRVAADLGHVRELHAPCVGAECVRDEAQPTLRDRDEGGLARGHAVAEERRHRGRVLTRGPVEEPDVPEGPAVAGDSAIVTSAALLDRYSVPLHVLGPTARCFALPDLVLRKPPFL